MRNAHSHAKRSLGKGMGCVARLAAQGSSVANRELNRCAFWFPTSLMSLDTWALDRR